MLERRGDGPSLADIMGRRELAGRGEGQLSRRELLRKALLAGVVVWGIEAAALAIGGLWPTGSRASTKVRVGTLDELIAANPGLPIDEGFPAYVPAAHAFVMLLDPVGGSSCPASTRPATAARSMSARCRRSVRTWAAARTRASRTSGCIAPATSRATTGSGPRSPASSTGRRRAAWTASPSRSTSAAC